MTDLISPINAEKSENTPIDIENDLYLRGLTISDSLVPRQDLRLGKLIEFARHCSRNQLALLESLNINDNITDDPVAVNDERRHDTTTRTSSDDVEAEFQSKMAALDDLKKKAKEKMDRFTVVPKQQVIVSDVSAQSQKIRDSIHHQTHVVHKKLHYKLEKLSMQKQWIFNELARHTEEMLIECDKLRSTKASNDTSIKSVQSTLIREQNRCKYLQATTASCILKLELINSQKLSSALIAVEERRDALVKSMSRSLAHVESCRSSFELLKTQLSSVESSSVTLLTLSDSLRRARLTVSHAAVQRQSAFLLTRWWKSRSCRLQFIHSVKGNSFDD